MPRKQQPRVEGRRAICELCGSSIRAENPRSASANAAHHRTTKHPEHAGKIKYKIVLTEAEANERHQNHAGHVQDIIT